MKSANVRIEMVITGEESGKILASQVNVWNSLDADQLIFMESHMLNAMVEMNTAAAVMEEEKKQGGGQANNNKPDRRQPDGLIR